eukprot:m.469166 g.469166  ORF g.469166 m.469166 type:complete len:94 (-) comp28212_c0_seq1:729-1010(-)
MTRTTVMSVYGHNIGGQVFFPNPKLGLKKTDSLSLALQKSHHSVIDCEKALAGRLDHAHSVQRTSRKLSERLKRLQPKPALRNSTGGSQSDGT